MCDCMDTYTGYKILGGTFFRNAKEIALTVSQMWQPERFMNFTTCVLHPLEVDPVRKCGELDMETLNLHTYSNNFWSAQGMYDEPRWKFECIFCAEGLLSFDMKKTQIPPFKHLLDFLKQVNYSS
jgi:hypothetical protein